MLQAAILKFERAGRVSHGRIADQASGVRSKCSKERSVMEAIFSVCSVQYKQGGWKSIEECAVKLVKDVYKMLFTDGGL
jgi:hypothetical protein